MSRAAKQPESNANAFRTPPEDSGPDFICIGQQKAGTRWLYDVLQQEPDFWIPPIKELHFFDARFDLPLAKAQHILERWGEKPRSIRNSRQRHRLRPLDARDHEFLLHCVTYSDNAASLDWYRRLFTPKNDLLSGDITPGYSLLNDTQIEKISKAFPDLRIILLIREPVSRAWSQFNMNLRRQILGQHRLKPEVNNNPQAPIFSVLQSILPGKTSTLSASEVKQLKAGFSRPTTLEELSLFLDRGGFRARSFPTEIYKRWREHFPAERIHVDFFDDIVARPKEVRTRILAFLGGADRDVEGRFPLDFNRKEGQWKREMSDEAREFLVEFFRDELLRCAEVFGGPAESWPGKYSLD